MAITTSHLPESKLKALALMPGAAALLEAVADQPGVHLVGGAVRDLMLGFTQFDFDLVVEGDATRLATLLTERIGGHFTAYERFRTATFRGVDDLVVDIATAREERYPAPGALPEVSPATLEVDLARRDFTVNAMAVALWREQFGRLTEHPGASADLSAKVLRVMHDASFIDDPTRLLRLLRYGARLGFTAEPHTETLARQAVAAGAPSTVSGPRIADELMDLLAERSALPALDSMRALELDTALDPLFIADEYVAARALHRLPEGVRQDLLLMAVCCMRMPREHLAAWLEHLGIEARERDVVFDAVLHYGQVLPGLSADARPSAVDSWLRRFKPETVALAAAAPDADRERAGQARDWLTRRRNDHLLVSGADLLAAGIPEGPAIGRALAKTLAAAIDGDAVDRDSQLALAVEFARAQEYPDDSPHDGPR